MFNITCALMILGNALALASGFGSDLNTLAICGICGVIIANTAVEKRHN